MMVSNKDMAKRGQWHTGASELDGYPIAAVNDVDHVVNNDHL
jgi:hypothetical protein